MMFPYPSAEGLHVGNIYAFTGADVHGRYQRLLGKDVFEPIGFDAFGIHSENFALKQGVHPMDLIPSNVANFTRQLRRIGGMFDWDHTVDTTTPEYYRWTQWIFLKLFEAGLAERKEAPGQLVPLVHDRARQRAGRGRVLRAVRHAGRAAADRAVVLQDHEYAERLLDNLEHIDWSETTKKAQANWIGRSEGAELRFPVEAADGRAGEPGRGPVIEVFTTRPDTVFGATYMVLAPEHPLVDRPHHAGAAPPGLAYREKAARMDLVARQKTDKRRPASSPARTAATPPPASPSRSGSRTTS
jgi:leucyl-tRNA synthetase